MRSRYGGKRKAMNDVPASPADIGKADLVVPPASAGLLNNRWLLALAARIGARLAAWRAGPFTIFDIAIIIRHDEVQAALARDLDFRIAPVNEARIVEVNGPFVLGMDRGATLAHERDILYNAFAKVALAPVVRNVANLAAARIAAAPSGRLDIIDGYARPIAAETAVQLFGIEGSDRGTLMDVARAVFAHTFLNLTNDEVIRQRALRAAALMKSWIDAEIAARMAGKPGNDLLGALLHVQGDTPDLTLVQRSIGGMLVGSIDTTATCVAKIMAVVASDAKLSAMMTADLDDPARLAGWCWEALRRWPHNPVLLRSPTEDTMFGKKRIKAGARVFVWIQAAMLDAAAFPDPHRLRPDRPIAAYLHFGGGLHVCAGRAVNGFQIPILVGALLRRGVHKVGKIGWAGPFPDHLEVEFA
jgi:cytochrome P450